MGKQKAVVAQRLAAQREAARHAASRRARHDPERLARLLIYGAIAALMLVVAGIVAFGYYETKIAPLNKTVIRAGDVSVSFGHYQRRLRYYLQQSANQSSNIGNVPNVVKNQLEDQAVTIAGGAAQGVQPSEAEIDAYIRRQLGVTPEAPNESFISAYRNAVKKSGLHVDEYRQMMRAQLVSATLRSQFQEQVPATAEQAHLRMIIVNTEEDAQRALDRIKGGEDFGAVASEVTLDPNGKSTGGDVPFSPRENLPAWLADDAFSLPIGQVSDIIPGDTGGFYLIQVLERDPNRELNANQKQGVANRRFQDWLDQQRDEQNLKDTLSTDDQTKALTWAVNHIDRKALEQPTPMPATVPTVVPQQAPAQPPAEAPQQQVPQPPAEAPRPSDAQP